MGSLAIWTISSFSNHEDALSFHLLNSFLYYCKWIFLNLIFCLFIASEYKHNWFSCTDLVILYLSPLLTIFISSDSLCLCMCVWIPWDFLYTRSCYLQVKIILFIGFNFLDIIHFLINFLMVCLGVTINILTHSDLVQIDTNLISIACKNTRSFITPFFSAIIVM